MNEHKPHFFDFSQSRIKLGKAWGFKTVISGV